MEEQSNKGIAVILTEQKRHLICRTLSDPTLPNFVKVTDVVLGCRSYPIKPSTKAMAVGKYLKSAIEEETKENRERSPRMAKMLDVYTIKGSCQQYIYSISEWHTISDLLDNLQSTCLQCNEI